MMRKLICLILLPALLLSGCAAAAPEESAAPAVSAPAEAAAEDAPAPTEAPRAFSDADTAAMSSFMSANRWLLDGERMFGLDYDEELRPALVSYRLKGGTPTDFRILCRDCVPEYLSLRDGRLYFLHEGRLQRLDLKTGERETLLEGPLKSLQIREDTLYLVDGAGRLLRAGPDGEKVETLLEGPCDYAWVMPEGILWQSEDEGCCLMLTQRGDASARRLTAAASYAPLRLGDTVWYSQRDSEGSVLAAVELTDGTVTRLATAELRGTAELIPTAEGWALRVFLAGDGWRQQLLRPGETEGPELPYSGYRRCDYVGTDCRVDAAYDPDGRLRCFVLVDAEGNETRFFGGELRE